MDLEIIAALTNTRAAYDKYSRFVKPTALGEEAWNIFAGVGEWYKNNPQASTLDWNAYGAWFTLVRSAKMDKQKLKVHKELITLLNQQPLDHQALAPMLHGLAKRDYAEQIGLYALRMADGEKGTFDHIAKLMQQYDEDTGKIDRLESSRSLFGVEALQEAAAPGLKWRLKCLNAGAGDLRKGDFVVIGKRPNTGGTTMLASEVTFMGEQLEGDEQIVWFNNEERGGKVTSRIMQAAIQWPTDRMLSQEKKAVAEYEARMGWLDRIVVYDLPKMHHKDVDELVDKHNTKLIVIDQGWKVKGFEEEGETVRQTLLANWQRELAKARAPVISVYQADGTAEGQRWINQAQLYYSKTGVQGEADLIVTIGRDFATGNSRYLWLPKNKMLTPGDRSMMDGRWELTLIADEARFVEHG